MARASSGSPPNHSGFTPITQPSIPQPYPTPSIMPYYGQHYQQGVLLPMVNPHETGPNHPMWCPPTHFSPNYNPYHQDQSGFGTQLPLERYIADPNQNFNHLDRSVNGGPVGNTYMGHRGHPSTRTPRAEPTYWQSPPSQYMVPQNSPALSTVESVSQGSPLPGPPESRRDSPLQSTQPRRNRRKTFPGASPPALTLFEGSKKPDWVPYSSDNRPNPRRGDGKRYVPSKKDSNNGGVAQVGRSFGCVPISNTPSVADSRQPRGRCTARNFPALMGHAQQPYLSKYQETRQSENRSPKYYSGHALPKARAPITTKFRKSYFAKPSIIAPATPNIHWVEMNRNNRFSRDQSRKANSNVGLRGYKGPAPDVELPSLSQHSASIDVVKRPSSPLIVTSVPQPQGSESAEGKYIPRIPGSKGVQSTSTRDPDKSSFSFNPKAADFIFSPKTPPSKPSGGDEYVGFYITPEQAYPLPPPENLGPTTYDCGPMTWQLPDILAPPKAKSLKSCADGECLCGSHLHPNRVKGLPKEFIGKIPGNMNWDNEAFTAVKEVSYPRSWASWDSEDEAEVLKRTVGTEFLSGLDANKEGPNGFCEVEKAPLNSEAPSKTEEQKSIGGNIRVDSPIMETKATQTIDDKDNQQVFLKIPSTQTNDTWVAGNNANYARDDSGPSAGALECIDCTELSDNSRHIPMLPPDKQFDIGFPNLADESQAQNTASADASQGLQAAEAQLEQKNIELGTLSGGSKSKGKNHDNKAPVAAVGSLSNSMTSAPAMVVDPPGTPNSMTKEVIPVSVLNYRDALLKRVENLQASVAPSPKLLSPKVTEVIPHKPLTPKILTELVTAKDKSALPTEIGGRRKFFLHPIPSTATYDSITQQLRGGILEDIYISGLSPHPSAWKGPKGTESRGSQPNGKDSKSWYGHVSFYSEEGAGKFWELVKTGTHPSRSYKSLYGGFDDEEPGFFMLDSVRVFVNWRHNDQRVVNPLTLKAVTQENATRCLLITFNTEAAMKGWNNKEVDKETGKPTKTTLVFDEHSFISKVAADIEVWGQADSNLQGIHLLDNDTFEKSSAAITAVCTSKPIPKEVRVLVSFIKLLTATKVKKYFSTLPEYCQDCLCKVEYWKDECAEPIDALKIIREAKETTADKGTGDILLSTIRPVSARNNGYEPRRNRRNMSRGGKGSTPGGYMTERNTNSIKENHSKGKGGDNGDIAIASCGNGGVGRKGSENNVRGTVEGGLRGKESITDDRKGNICGREIIGNIDDGEGISCEGKE